MKAIFRHLDAWIDSQRLTTTRRNVADQLSLVLRRRVTLLPCCGGGGQDRIFVARTILGPHSDLAAVRIPCFWKCRAPAEPDLPRQTLTAVQRLARECSAYERLAPFGLAPRLLARGTDFLANEHLPWQRASEMLRNDESSLWGLLPKILHSVRCMHELGVAHMDLNSGNILVSPDRRHLAFIDFEYAPEQGMVQVDRFRFDFLRLAHNLLKPRRGRSEAFRHPRRFLQHFEDFAPQQAWGIPDSLNPGGFLRLFEHPAIAAGFAEIFGVSGPETNSARFLSR